MDEKVTEILEDLFFVERGYLNANHFVYRDRPPVLIDTGYRASLEETHRIFIHLGIDISSVHTIFTTHCHCDHIGGNHLFRKLSDCDIILHEIIADSQSPIRCFKESPDFSIRTFLPLVKSGMSTKGMSII